MDLTPTVALLVAICLTATLLLTMPNDAARRRLVATGTTPPSGAVTRRRTDPAATAGRTLLADARARELPSLLAGFGAAVVVMVLIGSSLPGTLIAPAVGGCVTVLVRRRRAATERARDGVDLRQLPVAVDLLAACLAAGCQPVDAVRATATALGDGVLGQRLDTVAGALRFGVDPELAWEPLATDPVTADVARAARRSHRTGAPLAEALATVADDLRIGRRLLSRQAARRASVAAMAPLGGCFLPAFVLLAVVPLVAGLAARLFP
jgi:pilus assembly protein TadC